MAAIDTASQTYVSNGQTYDAHTGQVVTPPTVPSVVTATAPTGQTSVNSGPATPTAVVSSGPAATAAAGMKDTAIAAQADTVAQNAARVANQGKPGYDVFGNKLSGNPAAGGGATPPVTPLTPEQQIADTPDTGNRWLYDPSGNRIQMSATDPIPQGYSATNPKVAPTANVTDSATDTVGNTYKLFADGTYGKFDATGAYQGTASANDFQTTKTGEGLLNSINQVVNGTYPLTADQQAQVDGIKAQFASLIEQQKTANANFTGGTTVAENLYGMGNSLTGLGQIKGTIDAGIAKIADLNTKLTTAVAQMTAGFKTDNLNMLKDAYTIYSDTVKTRQDELDKLTAAATAAAKDARDFAEQQKMDSLTKMMDDNTISYQAKEQALAESQFSEEQKQNIFDNQMKKLQYQLDVRKEDVAESASNNTDPGSGLPTVGFTASGAADPASQQALLNSLPGGPNGDLAEQIKGLANYTIDPTTFTVRTLKGGTQVTRDQMVALAKRYDPNYNQANYAAAAKYIASFKATTANSTGGVLSAAKKGIVHFASLMDTLQSLDNGPMSATLNGPANSLKSATYGPDYQAKLKSAQTLALGVSDELAKFFKGSGSLDKQSIADWQKALNVNATPGQQEGLKDATITLLQGQLDIAYSNYETAMGHAPPAPGQPGSILDPASIAALKKLGVDTTSYMGVQPYESTTDSDLINSAPGNGSGGSVNTTDFFNKL